MIYGRANQKQCNRSFSHKIHVRNTRNLLVEPDSPISIFGCSREYDSKQHRQKEQ
jgi:hypothetical protein